MEKTAVKPAEIFGQILASPQGENSAFQSIEPARQKAWFLINQSALKIISCHYTI